MAIKIITPQAPSATTQEGNTATGSSNNPSGNPVKSPAVMEIQPDIAPDVASIQSQYPKVGQQIVAMWGSRKLQGFLNGIIFDERGNRQGFPLSTVSTLLRIYEYHAKLVPDNSKEQAWDYVEGGRR
jgi:hypothetical protein